MITDKTDGACARGVDIQGECYERSYTFASWFEAASMCDSDGGHIAEVLNEDIFAELVSSSRGLLQCYHQSFWLGATRNLLTWQTGTSSSQCVVTWKGGGG